MDRQLAAVGADIVDVERIARAMGRAGFLERCFTAAERRYCQGKRRPDQHFAARFAAKEALIKALGKRVPWLDVEVRNQRRGQPVLELSGRAGELAREHQVALSLSHCDCHALALVILWRGGKP